MYASISKSISNGKWTWGIFVFSAEFTSMRNFSTLIKLQPSASFSFHVRPLRHKCANYWNCPYVSLSSYLFSYIEAITVYWKNTGMFPSLRGKFVVSEQILHTMLSNFNWPYLKKKIGKGIMQSIIKRKRNKRRPQSRWIDPIRSAVRLTLHDYYILAEDRHLIHLWCWIYEVTNCQTWQERKNKPTKKKNQTKQNKQKNKLSKTFREVFFVVVVVLFVCLFVCFFFSLGLFPSGTGEPMLMLLQINVSKTPMIELSYIFFFLLGEWNIDSRWQAHHKLHAQGITWFNYQI